MEGLVGSQMTPITAHCKQLSSPFLPVFSTRFTKKFNLSLIGTSKSPKSLNLIAASIQPLEDAKLGPFDNTLPSKEVLELWRNANAVCFDVDSTVCLDEGIDELAEFCGAGKAVAEWTSRAMSGSVPFEEALAARLSLFNPSLSQVQDFLEKRPPRLSPGIEELVKMLRANNTTVYLISGGFRQMINAHGYKALVMIGDGATDLEARKPGGADLFICYAGVQHREAVAAKADWVVFNFRDLINSFE
ncbi:phosphoserine phosphatase [Quercus suber]|uniref:phosphoserine phosphatase n=1 Tax=Quercus suber TaxID=58331 RepID=A0AAW0KK37_QUESU